MPSQIDGVATEFGRIRSRHRLILSGCRAPAISRHASPPNRVKINALTLPGESRNTQNLRGIRMVAA